MLRLFRKSFGTYSKTSLNFQDSKCLVFENITVERFVKFNVRCLHLFPISSFMIFGWSYNTFALSALCILSNIPSLMMWIGILKPSIVLMYMLEDCQTIEIREAFLKHRRTFNIKDIKLIKDEDESTSNPFRKYAIEVEGNKYYIPNNSILRREDLLIDIINAEEINVIED